MMNSINELTYTVTVINDIQGAKDDINEFYSFGLFLSQGLDFGEVFDELLIQIFFYLWIRNEYLLSS